MYTCEATFPEACTWEQIRHPLQIFMLPCFTNPNRNNLTEWSQAGYQLDKWTQDGFPAVATWKTQQILAVDKNEDSNKWLWEHINDGTVVEAMHLLSS